MKRTFKYRIMANEVAYAKATNWLYLCRCLYNTALEQRISIYRHNKGFISCYSQNNQLPELKETFPEYKEISSHTLQDVIERLDMAYRSFFQRMRTGKGKPGFPRFRGKDRYDSFTLKKVGWKLSGKYLTVRNIGRFKLRLSRPIEGDIKTITIRTESNKWYACFACDNVPEHKLPPSDGVVGIDVGIKSFLVDSEGEVIDNPQYFKQSESLLRVRNRILSRRHKGSNRRKDAKLLAAKAHNKIREQRNDFLHKLSTKYVGSYGMIVFEDLNITNMAKNHCLAKSINDVGWGMFYKLCAYKAEEAGRQVTKIDRYEPSSKRCSECGAVNKALKLSDRQWICKECGVLHDRDHNAAKNIKRVGQTQQAQTCGNTQSVACASHNLDKRECQRAKSSFIARGN